MSTLEAKRAEFGRAGEQALVACPFGPDEVAALFAAQADGMFVWLIVLAGLSGFRPEFVSAVCGAWAVASAQWTGVVAV